jgi:hypothetical protein
LCPRECPRGRPWGRFWWSPHSSFNYIFVEFTMALVEG